MQFEADDELSVLLEDLDEWASFQVQATEQEAEKLDLVPKFLTPQEFWMDEAEKFLFPGSTQPIEDLNGASVFAARMRNGSDDDNSDEPQLSILKSRLEACEVLLTHVNRALSDLDLIESQHKLVSDKTHSLHEVCKRLLAEQTRLDRIVAGIQGPMTFFTSYDEIAPRLGVSADPYAKVKQRALHPDDAQFKKDIARIDECIAFLDGHPHYHDQVEYLKRFKSLQSHAMSMIKNWVVEEVVRLADFVLSHVKAPTQAQSDNSFLDNMYLYNRFSEKGKLLRPSIIEMEKRPTTAFPVYKEALAKLCSLRLRLLRGFVINSSEIQSKDSSIVTRILMGSTFLARVCAAEHALVSTFFSLSSTRQIFASQSVPVRTASETFDSASAMKDDDDEFDEDGNLKVQRTEVNPFFEELESLCTCFYDAMRPLIIREYDLENLCDASSAIESAIQDLDARMDRDAAEPLERVLSRIAFDIQERLVFCAVRVIRDQVSGFTPGNDLLDNPFGKTSGGGGDMWYPTLELTLSTLSKVYRAVEPIVFDQLATESVSACTKSLCDAAKKIAKRVNQDDADLFLIKHLLILREQISPFRAALSSKEPRLDFGSTSRALRQLFSQSAQGGKRSDLLNLIRFAGPTVRESDHDTKKELDAELKHSSETYILRVSKRALGPLLEFVDASQAYLQQEMATWEGLTSQDFASHKSVTEAVGFVEKQMIAQIAAAKDKAVQYIANPQTRSILFNAVETNAFKVVNGASNFAFDLFKDDQALNDRLRELVRQVGAMRSASMSAPGSPVAGSAGARSPTASSVVSTPKN